MHSCKLPITGASLSNPSKHIGTPNPTMGDLFLYVVVDALSGIKKNDYISSEIKLEINKSTNQIGKQMVELPFLNAIKHV